MVTLSEAFKLCRIKDECVYLQENGKSEWKDHIFWSKKVRDTFDMKKIKVVGIEPRFERCGYDFMGMRFIVTGITDEELQKAEYNS